MAKYNSSESKSNKKADKPKEKDKDKQAIQKKAIDTTDIEENSAYEIMPSPQGFITTPPDQEISESKKTPQWYVENVQYISSYYNVPYQNIMAPVDGGDVSTDTTIAFNQPIYQMIKYMQYYLGKQPNLDYNHLTQNVAQDNMQAQWIRGQDISELVKFMKGNILDRIGNINVSAKPMSEDAVSEREDMLKKLTMKLDLKPIFDRMKEAGLDYAPANGKEFESHDEIKDWVDEGGYKEVGAEYATWIANNFWYTNYCSSKFTQAFNYTVIAGVCALEHCVEQGRNYMKPRLPYQLILDTRVDDDYNREAQFVGVIDCMTPTQLFAKYPTQFSKKQKEDIYEMSKNQSMGAKYNTINNFSWWNYNGGRQNNTISVVTVYWYGRHDLGLKKGKNKYGVNTIGTKDKDENGDYILMDIHKATFVGNRYLLDYGYLDNIVEEFTDKSKPVFPIFRFMPDMIGGEFISIVGRLHKLQDELDALNFIIRERIGRAKGKMHVFNFAKMGSGTNMQMIADDFAKMGMTGTTTTGELPEGADRESLVETVDMSLDPMVMQYINLVTAKENKMKEIVSTSNIALGQQTSYIGLGTQQATIGQTTFGLKGLYNGFMEFVQMNLQYATNQEGRLLSMSDDLTTAMVVGDKGKKYLDVMKLKKISFEDILVYIKINDSIDEKEKAALQQAIFALFQNDKMTLTEFAEVMSSRTYTELKNKAERFEVIRDKKIAEAQKAEQERQLQLQAQQIQGANQAESLRQAGSDIRNNANNDAAMQQQMMQQQMQQQQQPVA